MTATALVHTPASTGPRLAASPDFGSMMDLARELVPTGFLPEHIRTPGQAVAIILQGRELGMQPMRALRSLTMVKGKVVENADSQLARFKDEGGRAIWQKLTETEAVLALRHPNGDEHTEVFTIKDATAAGLTKPSSKGEPSMFVKYPKAMLRSRAITAGLKSVGWSGAVGNYDPNEATEFAPASAGEAIASVQASTAHREPSLTAPGAETGAATADHLERIGALCEHAAIDESALAAKIRDRIKRPLTAARADELIAGLEAEIKKVTPAPVSAAATAEPTVAPLPAANEAATIDKLAKRYIALLAEDRVAPNVQARVQERMKTTEPTIASIQAAIDELEDAVIPF